MFQKRRSKFANFKKLDLKEIGQLLTYLINHSEFERRGMLQEEDTNYLTERYGLTEKQLQNLFYTLQNIFR